MFNELDIAVVTIKVYAGDDVTLSEQFYVGSDDNYFVSLDCGDEEMDLDYGEDTGVFSSTFAVLASDVDAPISCTFTNEGRPAELTLNKEVELGLYYDFYDDEFWLMANDGPTSGVEGIEGDVAITDAQVIRGVYRLEEEDAPGYSWLDDSKAIPAGGWDCEADTDGEFKGSFEDVAYPDEIPEVEGDEFIAGKTDLTILPGDDVVCMIVNEELPPIPVTLSFAKVSIDPSSGTTVFEWETVVEINNIGFAIYFQDNSDQWQPVDGGAFIISYGAGTTVQRYRYEAKSAIEAQNFILSDVNGYGGQRVHGPFELNEVFGSRADEQGIDWDRIRRENEARQ